MKSKLFILLLLSTTAHASRVEPPTEGECRYQNLSTRKHVPQTGACTFESYESVHVFTPGQGLSAAGGFRFKLGRRKRRMEAIQAHAQQFACQANQPRRLDLPALRQRRIVLETKLSGRAGLTQQPFEA